MHNKHCTARKIPGIAAVILSLLMLASCVSTYQPADLSRVNMNDVTLDVSDMADSLMEKLTFDDTLSSLEEDIAAALLHIEGLYNSMAAYGSTGATAEMLVILRCESSRDAEEAEARLQKYREEMAAVYAGYNMKESEKLTKSVLVCEGRYVFFCVSPDTEAVTEAYQLYIVESLKK